MHAPAKYVEKGLSWLANGLWYAIQPLYRISPNPSITPAWSDKPLLKSQEKFRPTLGVPRDATSLCARRARAKRARRSSTTRPRRNCSPGTTRVRSRRRSSSATARF